MSLAEMWVDVEQMSEDRKKSSPIKGIHSNAITTRCMSIQFANHMKGVIKGRITKYLNISYINSKNCNYTDTNWCDIET